jgi:DNA-binding transcriptional regulator PaaX
MPTEQKNFQVKDLIEILAIGGVLIAAIVAPNAVQGFRFLFKNKNRIPTFKEFSQSRVKLYANRLEKSGIIKRERRGDKIRFVLTKKGRKIAQRNSVNEIKLVNNIKWDKVWRIVIFDIPEKKKVARDALRQKLIRLGMHQLQKSVFIYPYECKNEIDFIADFFKVSEDILYLHAKLADVDEKVRKIFDL